MRSVEDKMSSLKSTYTLIKDHNNGTLVGSTGRLEWFEIPIGERAEILKKWGRVALSAECFAALGAVFEDDPCIEPVYGGVELGAAALTTQTAALEARSTGKKRSRANDIAETMHDVMDKAVRTMESIAQRDREALFLHQKEENEKTRALLRELFESRP
ncbi:hypothetical protein PHMEG_00021369 [Phytophthora megakarya]|uniref:Uncharacterized protein n=1 Tax=Phytophthora megakarya TaxID=4795 RepID=A0A225VLD2_9STRA|nr:hypothetical protein PHMEG_00021369 [Phytophthora megakarya]